MRRFRKRNYIGPEFTDFINSLSGSNVNDVIDRLREDGWNFDIVYLDGGNIILDVFGMGIIMEKDSGSIVFMEF